MSDYNSRVRLWYNSDVARSAASAVDATPSNTYIVVAGDQTTLYPVGHKFRIKGSASDPNDGIWTVKSTAFSSAVTRIYTVADLAASTTPGYVHRHAIVGHTVGTLSLSGQPLDTETVIIASKVYTFQTVLTNTDGHVLIGGNASASLDNLIAAITLGAGSGTAYAALTTANAAKTWAFAGAGDTMTLYAETGIDTLETLTNGLWGAVTAQLTAAATTTFRITGDQTTTFPEGRPFAVSDANSGTNDGGYVVSTSTFTARAANSPYLCGHTDIVVTTSVPATPYDGTIDRYECFTYDIGANAQPKYSLPGRRVTDRLGLVHRVMPVTNIARYVNTVGLSMLDIDLDLVSTEGNMLATFLNTHCILADDYLEIFTELASVNQNDTAYSYKRCYKVKIEDVPSWIFSNQSGLNGNSQDLMIEAFCSQDGTFTDWNDLTSTTYRTKPA